VGVEMKAGRYFHWGGHARAQIGLAQAMAQLKAIGKTEKQT